MLPLRLAYCTGWLLIVGCILMSCKEQKYPIFKGALDIDVMGTCYPSLNLRTIAFTALSIYISFTHRLNRRPMC